MKCPSGMWISFTCKWSKVHLVAEERFEGEVWGKMGDRVFFFLPPTQTKTLLTQQAPDDYTCSTVFREIQACVPSMHPPHVFLSHPSTTVVIMHVQTDREESSPWLFTETPSRSSSVLTAVTIVTVSHTHMCGIRGQGSWVVLGGLNGSSVCHHTEFQ